MIGYQCGVAPVTSPSPSPHAVDSDATMSLALQLLDGVEGTVYVHHFYAIDATP